MSSTINNRHKSTKINPLLDWYQRTTGNLVDRMCCVSYSNQVSDDEEPLEYDVIRNKMVIPDWIQEYQEQHEEQGKNYPSKEQVGRLTLQGDSDDCMGKCYFSPAPSPGRSDATATTVSMSTVRTSRTLASQSTINVSNRTLDGSSEQIIVDDIVYVRSESLDERTRKSPREIDVPAASRYRRYRSERYRDESPPPLQTIPSGALPNLPYLSLTEGYEC